MEQQTLANERWAPGDLEIVQRFANTNDVEAGVDGFAEPGDLERFLTTHGLLRPDARVSRADLGRAIEMREALRSLLLANAGHASPDDEALDVLNRTAARARLIVRFDGDGSTRLEPDAPGVDGALGRIIASVYTAMQHGTWPRLKACLRDTCQWAFYDFSKNGSSRWCSMRVCGNREKAKAFRARNTRRDSRDG